MLNELDLLYCYPLFNVILALPSVVAIANLRGNKVTKLMIVMGGALGLGTPYLVPYVYSYFYFICEAIASLTILLYTNTAKVYIGGNTENTVSKIQDSLTSKRRHLTMYSKAPSAGGPGINLGGCDSVGSSSDGADASSSAGSSGSGGIGTSSSGSANTTGKSVSQTPRSSGRYSSCTPAQIDRIKRQIPGDI